MTKNEAHKLWRDSPQGREKCIAQRRRVRQQLRAEMIQAYGGRCSCCGEPESAFLTLDHKFNDGAEDRKRHNGQMKVLYWLRKSGWPTERYQLLCYNCNCAKQFNGFCPHQVKSGKIEVRLVQEND